MEKIIREEFGELLGDDNGYLLSLGESKVTVSIEVQSRINYDKIEFSYLSSEDIKLVRTLRIFEYHHKVNHKYSIKECSEATGISLYFVKKVLKKYLDYKKLK